MEPTTHTQATAKSRRKEDAERLATLRCRYLYGCRNEISMQLITTKMIALVSLVVKLRTESGKNYRFIDVN